MTSTVYYIGANSKFLQNDGTFGANSVNTKTFSDYNSALTHIDTLPNGEYRIFSHIVKT